MGKLSMTEPDWAEQRRVWYSKPFIGLEMAKLLSHRELVILEKPNPEQQESGRKLKTIRCCAGFTYDLLKSNFEAFRVFQHPYVNMYYSLMHLKKTPLFSFAPAQRSQSYKIWTDGAYKEEFDGYDFALDFDGDDGLDLAKKDCIKVKSILDQFQVPHSVRFSGSRGFHLAVDSRHLPQLPEEKIVGLCGELGAMIKGIEGLETLDDSIFDARRVFKLPYSFCQGKIVLPLDDDHLKNFDVGMVEPSYVMRSIRIQNRGLMERYADLPLETSRANFLKMAREFIDPEPYLK